MPARAQVFTAASARPAANGPLLERLTHVRRDIAHLLGAPSFAHHQLRDGLLAARPEAVAQFLGAFSSDLQPLVGPLAGPCSPRPVTDGAERCPRLLPGACQVWALV